MTEPADIRLADPTEPAARDCLAAYYAELARRFPTGFDVARSRDPDAADMTPPRGAFLVAYTGRRPAACVGLKGPGPVAEIKRLWVSPAARGRGLAVSMMNAIEAQARSQGVLTLRLDTNRALPEAEALYDRLGWTRIDRYNDDPYAEVFFEKSL